MKHLGVLLLPPGRDASRSQGYSLYSSMSPVPIYTPGCRETKWSKVPCLRKQRDGRGLRCWPLGHTHLLYICIKLHSLRSCKVALHQPEIPSQPAQRKDSRRPFEYNGLIAIQYLRIYVRLKWLLWSTVYRQWLIFPRGVTCHSFLSNSFCLLVCLFFIFRLNESCF